MSQFYTLTITGPDRPGIIAALTETIYKAGGNLEDATMTILEGEFAMILIVCFPKKPGTSFLKQIELLKKTKKLAIELKPLSAKPVRSRTSKSSVLITVSGKDQAGIVFRISKLLSDLKINITDLNSRIVGEGKKTVYLVFLEADLPSTSLFKTLQSRLDHLSKQTKLSVLVRPLEAISA